MSHLNVHVSAALVESSWTNWLQDCRHSVQVPAQDRSHLSNRWTRARVVNYESRCSLSSLNLIVRRTRLSIIVNLPFWLLVLVLGTVFHFMSLLLSGNIFKTRLKIFLFSCSFPELFSLKCKVPARCLWHFGHYNRLLLLLASATDKNEKKN